MKVIDNYLNKDTFKNIADLVLSDNFPWFYNENITQDKENEHVFSYGFTHIFHDGEMRNTYYAEMLTPVINKIKQTAKGSEILRSRLDMTMSVSGKYLHTPHIDYPYNNITTIFYLNDSDGDTVLFDEYGNDIHTAYNQDSLTEMHRVSPKANRLLIYEGNRLHTGNSPIKHKRRILLNSNFTYL